MSASSVQNSSLWLRRPACPTAAPTSACAKLPAVSFPVALDIRQDALVAGVRTQFTPVFVALEPWVIVVA